MDINDFIEDFQEILFREEAVTVDMNLADIEEWDSMSIMGIIAWYDKNFQLSFTFEDFKSLKTVRDVAALCKDIQQ